MGPNCPIVQFDWLLGKLHGFFLPGLLLKRCFSTLRKLIKSHLPATLQSVKTLYLSLFNSVLSHYCCELC